MNMRLKSFVPKKLRNAYHLLLAYAGAIRYGFPSKGLHVIGVTGTSGKSSTIFFLRQIVERAGLRVGSLSTIDVSIAGRTALNDKKMTMLGHAQIQQYLREMANAGCNVAIIEMTSEGAVQHRHRGINADIMVLTNLYPEHIESHGSFEKYQEAKISLFRYAASQHRKPGKPKIAIVPRDFSNTAVFLGFPFDEKILFDADGVVAPPHFGAHQANNIAAASAIARAMGISEEKIADAVAHLEPPPGRVEYIQEAESHGFRVIVDYAFEPVAVAALYETVAELHPKRIIHVFGSTGGGRDVARRQTVGSFVGAHADIAIVTNEDPYDDDPLAIIEDVARAVEETGKVEGVSLFRILDRKEAICKAVRMARSGDVVLVTGKGSEQGMAVHGILRPWDDRRVVRECLVEFDRH